MPKRLVNQLTATPTRKIQATGIAGGLTSAVLGVLHWAAPDITGVMAAPVEAGIVAVVATVAGYFTRERAEE